MQFGGEVFNFGINNQSEATLSMNMSLDGNTVVSGESGFTMYSADADGFYNVEETDGVIDSDESVYFQLDAAPPSTELGMYTVDFSVESLNEMDGSENFGNNIQSREFEITEDLYSIDGIGVYSNPVITRLGTGSFTDGTDGFMIMTYYEIEETTDVAGLEILLDSDAYTEPLTVAGGEIVISGNIIVRQRGTKIFPGENVGMGKDHSIFSVVKGKVVFKKTKSDRTFVSVKPN